MRSGLLRLPAALVLAAALSGCAIPLPHTVDEETQEAVQEAVPESVSPSVGAELQRGIASWYGLPFHGRRTASGERFDMTAMTAAHPTLPFGTHVKVRSLENGREVTVRINDRGPFTKGRIIDLSHAAARAIGLLSRGTKAVSLSVVEPRDAIR
ncbi:septal ring lytic transglycosylase RlpA family protein [Ramlibacter henchirensis]|uniref:Endolytic peptidoglycan transglycosylase RlpA n=1 Tax=Ramlibacter henchirensis TaxID=204072 RepID=A0A4Z0C8M1_9BURK|nr:septal ring lytic transglycosylase RlpA family protein [Ramlibacter henchirensis]